MTPYEKQQAWASKYNMSDKQKSEVTRRWNAINMTGNRKIAQCMVVDTRQRAKTRGQRFKIGIPWILKRLEAGVCELTGIKFDENKKGLKPTIGRIDSKLEYVESNCRVILRSVRDFRQHMTTDKQMADIAVLIWGKLS